MSTQPRTNLGLAARTLSAHWSRSTFTDREPYVDKCDGCGAVVYTWGEDDPAPDGIEPLAAHQAAMLIDADGRKETPGATS